MTTPALAENVRGKGRHYMNPITEELVPSITNVIGIMDKPALPRWSALEVAKKAWELRLSLPEMEETDAIAIMKGAPWRKSDRAADRGTDIHGYLEARLNGWAVDDLSPDAEPYKPAADAWLASQDWEVVATELTVFHPTYAGTGDLWCRVGGKMTILDFKTSKAIYPEAALQLSALWGAYRTADGKSAPHVGEDTDLIVVRIGEDGFEEKKVADPNLSFQAFLALRNAWEWKHTKPYEESN